jgi:oligoendopeptidase F
MAKKGKASKTKLKARKKAAAPKKTGKQKTAKAAKSPNLGVVPRWDLSNVYPGLESDQFEAAVQDLKTQLDELDAYTQAHRIGKSENGPVQGNTDELARVLADYLDKTNRILRLYATLNAYIFSFTSTDSYNQTARRLDSELDQLAVR